jgi:hypothetical protein
VTRVPSGILADIALYRARTGRELEPVPPGSEWLGSRLDGADRVLVWRAPDGAVVEQRLPLLNLKDRERARRARAAFRIVPR